MQQLGPYRIDGELGRGGMGTVYSAVDQETDERAAIKVLAHSYSQDAHFRARFEVEIETLKKLRHPNIVELMGFGEQDSSLYYAMELVEGRSLADELHAGRRFDWREVVVIGKEVCAALRHAHDRGIIHRDLKPANLLLDAEGRIKLTDFGIAKLFGGSHLTADGGVLGTADHMAPEQAEGQPATVRSDLYSLGSLLYTLLARRSPFAAQTVADVIHGLKYEQPTAVEHYAPEVPQELSAVIHKLLDKDPGQRISTAQAVANRLSEIDLNSENGIAGGGNSAIDDPPAPKTADRATVPYRLTERLREPDHEAVTIDAPTYDSEAELAAAESASSQQPDVPHPADHFTTVDMRTSKPPEAASEPAASRSTMWFKLTALFLALAVAVLFIWLAVRTEPADSLFAKIAKANEDQPRQLIGVEKEIDRFLAQHPSDPRARQVAQLKERIALFRWEKDIRLRARDVDETTVFPPAVGIYLDALAIEKTDPELASQKFEALLTLFNETGDDDSDTARCLASARSRLPLLKQAAADHITRQREWLSEKLQQADELSKNDPAKARALWKSVIELYGDKTWAAEAVVRAQHALADQDN